MTVLGHPTCAVILGLFVFDFFAHVRVPHEPIASASRPSGRRFTSVSRCCSVLHLVAVGGERGGEYFAGYVTEGMSVDNLFVFTVIMASFAVPGSTSRSCC